MSPIASMCFARGQGLVSLHIVLLSLGLNLSLLSCLLAWEIVASLTQTRPCHAWGHMLTWGIMSHFTQH